MKKSYKNINEEVDRIKNLFTEERLYGNLIIEAPISSFKNIFTSMDEVINLLIKSKNLDEASAEIIKNTLKSDLNKISNSINTIDDVKKSLDPNEVNNITKKISDNFNDAFKNLDKNIKIPYKNTTTPLGQILKVETSNIINTYNNINSEIINKLNEVISKRSKFPDELTKEINELYPSVGDKIKKLYNPLIYKLVDSLKVGLKNILNNRKDYFSKLENLVKNPYFNKAVPFLNTIVTKDKKFSVGSVGFDIFKIMAYRAVIGEIYCRYVYTPENKLKIKEQQENKNQLISVESELFSFIMRVLLRFGEIPFSKFKCTDLENYNKILDEQIESLDIDPDTKKELKNTKKKIKNEIINKVDSVSSDVKTIVGQYGSYIDTLTPEQKQKLIDEIALEVK